MPDNLQRVTSHFFRLTSQLSVLMSHSGFRRYFANTGWLFAEKVFRMIVGLFVGVWVARYLGPEEYGILNYAQSFVGLFSGMASLGLDGIVVRELLMHPEKDSELIGTALVLRLIGACVTLSALSFAITFTSNDGNTNILVYIIASAAFFQAFNVIDMFFQAKVMGKLIAYANAMSFLASSVIKIVLILFGAPLIFFAGMVAFDSFLLGVGYIYFYFKKSESKIQKIRCKKETAFSLLRDSWPLALSGLVIMVYMRIDQVMIKEMLNSEAVGEYAAAVKISEIWLFLTVIITASLFPAIINAKKESEKKYRKRVLSLYRLLVFISLIISLFVFLFSDTIIFYTYGIQYKASVDILEIYVWSIIFVFLNNGSWRWYIAENLQHIATLRLSLGAIINIVLNALWIKKYGLSGAAYATLVSYSIATYFGNVLSKKTWINFKMQTIALVTFFWLKEV